MKFVKSDKPLTTDHKTFGEISVDHEVPQVESLDEFVTFAGGNDQALSYINEAIAKEAKTAGRIALRAIPENADLDASKQRVAEIVKSYTPQSSDGRQVRAKKVEAFDQVQALVSSGKEFTREELLALLASAK